MYLIITSAYEKIIELEREIEKSTIKFRNFKASFCNW